VPLLGDDLVELLLHGYFSGTWNWFVGAVVVACYGIVICLYLAQVVNQAVSKPIRLHIDINCIEVLVWLGRFSLAKCLPYHHLVSLVTAAVATEMRWLHFCLSIEIGSLGLACV